MARTGTGRVYQRSAYVDANGQPCKKTDPGATKKTLPTWWIQYGHRGKIHRESSESTKKKDATDLLKKRLGELGGGKFVGQAAERVSFEDLMRMIRDDYAAQRRRATKQLESTIKRLGAVFAGSRAVDITTDRLTAYVAARQTDGYAAGTIRKDMACIRRAYRLAIRAGHLATMPYIPNVRVQDAREGFLTMAEVEKVATAIGSDLGPVVRFAAFTGWRKREVLGLTWARVDFDAGEVRLEASRSKNSEGRVFPFQALPPLVALMEAQRARTREVERRTGRIVTHVFHRDGDPILSMRSAWGSACRKAGIPGAWFHDLRRTAVMHLERAGVPRSVAMKLTGHKTEAVYRRYAIADAASLAEGVGKLAKLHGAATPEPAKVVSLAR